MIRLLGGALQSSSVTCAAEWSTLGCEVAYFLFEAETLSLEVLCWRCTAGKGLSIPELSRWMDRLESKDKYMRQEILPFLFRCEIVLLLFK